MSAATIQKEREFWSQQLDNTSIEEANSLSVGLRWIDAEEPGDFPKQRAIEPLSINRFTLWDV